MQGEHEPPVSNELESRLTRLETKFDERWKRIEKVLENQCPTHDRRLRELEQRMVVLWGASSAVFSTCLMGLLIWVRVLFERSQ